MKIEFKNGSSIESIDNTSGTKRSKRADDQIAKMSEQLKYWHRNPDKFMVFVAGQKLPWYQKWWVKLHCIISKREYE